MAAILVIGATALLIGVPGYFIGALGLSMGNLASATVIRLALKRSKVAPIRAGQTTTTSTGQIR